MTDQRVLRVQDADGRGPFRPGFSHRWLDADVGSRDSLPTWIEEFGPSLLSQVGAHEACGSAVRGTDGIARWFTRRELKRLRKLGYRVVELQNYRVLAESDVQMVVAWPRTFVSSPRTWLAKHFGGTW